MQEYNKKMNINHLLNTKIGKYIVEKFLGKGSYGSVYRAINQQNNKYVAIKVIDLSQIQRDPNSNVRQIRRRLAKTQAQLMMKCDSQNVLKCYQVFQAYQFKILVIQYCNGGTLETEIIKKKKIQQGQAITILKQVIIGIAELHKKQIIHRDLKSENIFIHNGIYKIADLGFSKIIACGQSKHTRLGTLTTMAPEILKAKPYGLKADIWSIGVIFYQMLVGKLPFVSQKPQGLYEKIKNTQLFQGDELSDSFAPKLSLQTVDCLKKMLKVDSKQRISWSQLLNHPIFFDQKQSDQILPNLQLIKSVKDISIPKIIEIQKKLEDQKKQILNVEQPKKQNEQVLNQPEIIPINLKQIQIIKQKINESDTHAYHWGKKIHWQCLKTELIYKKIIVPIQKSQSLSMSRKHIQFLYLLSSRCFFNLSPINQEINNGNNSIAINLKNIISQLYKKVYKTFEKYSNQLHNKQSRILSIISDKVKKIVKNEVFQQKQKFLIGIQYNFDESLKGVSGQKQQTNDFGDFTKKEQILFTKINYIEDIIKDIIKQKNLKQCILLLENYQMINNIQKNDKKSFKQCVNQIIQKKIQ